MMTCGPCLSTIRTAFTTGRAIFYHQWISLLQNFSFCKPSDLSGRGLYSKLFRCWMVILEKVEHLLQRTASDTNCNRRIPHVNVPIANYACSRIDRQLHELHTRFSPLFLLPFQSSESCFSQRETTHSKLEDFPPYAKKGEAQTTRDSRFANLQLCNYPKAHANRAVNGHRDPRSRRHVRHETWFRNE